MRLWSIHPKYLDSKGLVACWRESLLARKVLEGNTKGYKNHPQLQRFKDWGSYNAHLLINDYLIHIFTEANCRGYKFDLSKVGEWSTSRMYYVTKGQLNFEINHLMKKLKIRDINKYKKCYNSIFFDNIEPHPLFTVVDGDIESWEKV